MKRILVLLAALGVAASLTAVAGAASSSSAKVVISHEYVGCHSWSVNGGPAKAAQSLKLATGGSVTFTDNDVMAHLLLEQSGPAKVSFAKIASAKPDAKTPLRGPGLMAHLGAGLKVTFPKAGTYTFTTKAGEDYTSGIQTKGEDHVLTLKVVVA